MLGIHGIGVSAPSAAAVAAATCGLAKLEHTPNGITFIIGAWSMIFATGDPANTWPDGTTARLDGAAPKVHIKLAPAHTGIAIACSPPEPNRSEPLKQHAGGTSLEPTRPAFCFDPRSV